MFLIFAVPSNNDFFKWSCDFMVGSPSKKVTISSKFGGHRRSGSGVCHMILT